MRNNKKIILSIVIGVLFLNSCTERDLTVDPKGSYLSSNYYKDEAEAYTGVVASYEMIKKNSGGFENMITFFNAASDDQYAGGGASNDGVGIQSFSNYSIDPLTIPSSYWNDYFRGIFRANILISKLPGVAMDENLKKRFESEGKALRAYYYFELVTMFKNVPLFKEPISPNDIYNVTQAKPEDVYALIESDLTSAIPNLPAIIPSSETGRFSQGAAKALLGKVYLYEGKKAQAASVLAEVNGTPGGTSQYGYKLLSNFSDLWVVSNKFNSESILEVAHTNKANAGWGNWGNGDGNSICVMSGPRDYVRANDSAPDLASGWSFNVFTDEFYNFIKNDPRASSTVFNIKPYEEYLQSLTPPKKAYTKGFMDTGYFMKKYLPTKADVTTGGGDAVLNYQQDSYIIRLADTYLLEAEALGASGARAQALLDAVRARVGLPSVPVSMQAIKEERRKELAGEGQRWFDLVRWGDAPSVLGSRGFKAGKNEILPIPVSEIKNTKIVQNPGY